MTPADLILWALAIAGTIILTALAVAVIVAVTRGIRTPPNRSTHIMTGKSTR